LSFFASPVARLLDELAAIRDDLATTARRLARSSSVRS